METMIEEQRDFQSEIKELIEKSPKDLETQLEEYHMFDISRVVIELEPERISEFFNMISFDFSASIFEYLEVDEAEEIIGFIPESRIVKILEIMDLDEAVDLVKFLKNEGLNLLKKIRQPRRRDLIRIMSYDEDEIGAFMSDGFLTIDIGLNVKQAMKHVTTNAHDVDYISIIYITEDNKLKGYIKLKDLIVARANEMIFDIMETRFEKALPTDDKEVVASVMQETGESSIPIVNEADEIIGIITHDDVMDIIADTEEEDYTKFAAVLDSDIDIESSNLRNSVKTRLPWLAIL